MTQQSINKKKKIYFYLLILLFLTTTFNFNIISKFQDLILISNINVLGLSKKEKRLLEKNLEIFINKNIFLISKQEVDKIIKEKNFLENYKVVKVFPSKLLVKVKKTEFVGKTIVNGEKFYIGKNGRLTNIFLVEKEYNLPQVFGNFPITEFLELQTKLTENEIDLSKFKKYFYYKSKRWDIQKNDNTTLMLPSSDINKSLNNYKSLLKVKKLYPGQLIDLRIKNKIITRNE
tara:strand:- start:1581 stop:2276 length:696 start_codon:yes stop_codon:yes gene_type:complete